MQANKYGILHGMVLKVHVFICLQERSVWARGTGGRIVGLACWIEDISSLKNPG